MYQIKIRTNDTAGWTVPMFPKCSESIDDARRDANMLIHVYDNVAIVDEEEKIVEEVSLGESE